MECSELSDREGVKLHLLSPLTQHIAAMTSCPVIVCRGLSGVSWPEYLKGYAGLASYRPAPAL